MVKHYALVDDYVDFMAKGKSECTNKQRTEVLNRFLRILEEEHGVKITDEHIEGLNTRVLTDFYRAMSKKSKMATLNYYVCMINPFLRWAYDYTDRQGNPCLVGAKKEVTHFLKTGTLEKPEEIPEWEKKDKYLTHDQAVELLNSCEGRNRKRDRAVIALLLYSGLRISELCSLQIRDIKSWENGELYCRRKGGAYKTVYYGTKANVYLKEYLASRTDRKNPEAPLFTTSHGEPCSRVQLYKALRNKQRPLGLATGPHALRHTFISEAEKLGSASIARDLANQHSLRITNRYDHTTRDQLTATVDRMEW